MLSCSLQLLECPAHSRRRSAARLDGGRATAVGGRGAEPKAAARSAIVSIAVGNTHTAANTCRSCTAGLKVDGTAVATGRNSDGRCKVHGRHGITAIAAGSTHTPGLREDGTAIAVGNNAQGQCDVEQWRSTRLPQQVP